MYFQYGKLISVSFFFIVFDIQSIPKFSYWLSAMNFA